MTINNIPDGNPNENLSSSANKPQGEITPPNPQKSSENRNLEEESIPPEVVETIENLPPDLPPEEKVRMTSMLVAMGKLSSSSSSMLAKRITPEHITETLKNLDRENERDYRKSQSSEWTKRLIIITIPVLIAMVFVFAGVTKDKENKQLAEKVIIAAISGLGGYGLGVGTGKKDK